MRTAVIISGEGSLCRALLECFMFPAEIELIIRTKDTAGDLSDTGIPTVLVDWARYRTNAVWSDQIWNSIHEHDIQLVLLAGCVHKILPNRMHPTDECTILNIHPSLIPAFSGKGYYGTKVHQAAFERGVHYSGCTVHEVTDEYDAGPILRQQVVDVRECLSVEEIQAAVKAVEPECYAEAIRELIQ